MISGFVKRKAQKKINNLMNSFDKNRSLAVKESVLKIHENAVKIVSENKGGTVAFRYNPKRLASVSQPGNPPHTDTGRLRQSIKFEYEDGIGLVGSNLKYAAWLEFGTENMAARPWLSVAVERSSKDIAKIFAKWMDKALKGVLK